MKKVLFVATVTRHINAFHIPYLKWFKEQGYEVHVASNGSEEIKYCDRHFNLPFARFPLKMNNIKTYKELKKIINDNNYEIIHCHTPVGGVLTRLAARKTRKKVSKVIYTAHGFHFYKGASILNWIIYYPIEKWMAHYTDCLITINNEDYEIAKKKIKEKEVELIHGVGLDTKRFDIEIKDEDKIHIKKKFGIEDNDIVLTYVAELNKNKNQILLIDAMGKLKNNYPNIKLILVGPYPENEYYKEEIRKRNLEREVVLTGKTIEDVPVILSITNIYLASSIREGLPVNIMEAMYMGLPIVATDNRGHRELIENGLNGYLVSYKNEEEFVSKIEELIENEEKIKEFANNSKQTVEKYLLKNVIKEMEEMYKDIC